MSIPHEATLSWLLALNAGLLPEPQLSRLPLHDEKAPCGPIVALAADGFAEFDAEHEDVI